ncbi:CoA transferase [Nioella nitratireducens]|uniref:CoA transferase n=1 Tax=Nioella nitratireducens TaxID=1287720 RepID=UPI0008FD09A9|nr:CoA transferase [Nioella nitratireducens]
MKEIAEAIGLSSDWSETGRGDLPSVFRVSDLAAASMAAVGQGVAELRMALGHGAADISVDRRLAALWFSDSIAPQGWALPPAWDDLAGDYLAADGWIKLHTNAPHHRAAAIRALGCVESKEHVARAVAAWQAEELEAAVVAEGGVAAQMRGMTSWAEHLQGRAVVAEPLVAWGEARPASIRDWGGAPDRPLHGVRVLDLTRILAGPVATRALAGFGADVVRIDPVAWDEPSLAPDVTLGKRCARLDLRTDNGQARFATLLQKADVLVHGYRPDALDRLGIGADWRRSHAPHVIEASLCAYGWTGPWAKRRGYDSLVQMSSGIAEAGMARLGRDKPTPLPVQALDHATGYLIAASVLAALRDAAAGKGVRNARLSLARTAALLQDYPSETMSEGPLTAEAADYAAEVEHTTWGPARRLRPAIVVEGAPMHWTIPAGPLGRHVPVWSTGPLKSGH